MARIGTTPSNRNSRDRKTASYLFTPPIIVGVDLVANDAADYGPADCSNSATIRQDGARDATDASADRSILVLSRHPATTTQANQHG
jgi:hypothetical protein